jgi:hypothetical protein
LQAQEAPASWRAALRIGTRHPGLKGFLAEQARRVSLVQAWVACPPEVHHLPALLHPERFLGAALAAMAQEEGAAWEEARWDARLVPPGVGLQRGTPPRRVWVDGATLVGAHWVDGQLAPTLGSKGGGEPGGCIELRLAGPEAREEACWPCPLYVRGAEGDRLLAEVQVHPGVAPGEVWMKRGTALVVER